MDKSKWTIPSCCTGTGLASFNISIKRTGTLLIREKIFLMCISVFLALFTAPLFAESAVSGEYAWYQDTTFKRASYIGFLYYDENTLLMRYYAPMDAKQGLAETIIDIYVTHNGGTLTGERVIGGEGDKAQIVNYLHDLFYDFSKGDEVSAFGNNASIEKDDLIPIFGVKRIKGADNKVDFQIITVGRISSSDDKSFAAFRGLPTAQSAKKKTAHKKIKAGKRIECQAGEMRFSLDSNWHRSMDNMWMLGDDAVLTIAELNADASKYIRLLVQSRGESYIDWRTLKVQDDAGRISMECTMLDTPAMHTWRIAQGGYLFTLTAMENTYQTQRSYFEGIVKSFGKK